MHCMRCGRKIEDQKVFCADCLTEMEQIPVDPGTTVHIPARPDAPPAKKKSRRAWDAKPDEQIRRLKVVVRCLCIALVASLIAFAITAGILLKTISDRDGSYTVGQNYGTITDSDN